MGKKAVTMLRTSVDDAVSSAFSDAEELKDELQQWFDNLPENLLNSSKGEALQEAIDALEQGDAPDVPERLQGTEIEIHETVLSRMSRRKRLDNCITRLEAAIEHARTSASELEELEYEKGKSLPDYAPETEEKRDELVTELQAFADECENATDAWNGVEFPGARD